MQALPEPGEVASAAAAGRVPSAVPPVAAAPVRLWQAYRRSRSARRGPTCRASLARLRRDARAWHVADAAPVRRLRSAPRRARHVERVRQVGAGTSLVNSTRRPSAGCAKPRLTACSHCLVRPSRAASTGSAPYSRSPTHGCRIAAMCTRIWWVRPVSSLIVDQAGAAERLQRVVVRDARPAPGDHGEPAVAGGVPGDRRVHRAAQRVGVALHQGVVALVHLALAERPLQRAVGTLALGHAPSARWCWRPAGARCPAARRRRWWRPCGRRRAGPAARSARSSRASGGPPPRRACPPR